MMTSQPLFIPLYFDEAEEDLWLVLQRVEPEKRSSFIKETLRQVLLGNNSEELLRHPPSEAAEDIPEIDDSDYHHKEAQAEEVLEKQTEPIESFSLEDLFVQTSVPHSDKESVILSAHEDVKTIPGYEYLMMHIIGTEEDEAVLMVLNQRAGKGQAGGQIQKPAAGGQKPK